MSFALHPVLIVVLVMAAFSVWQIFSSLPGSLHGRANRRRQREKQRIGSATTTELLREVRVCLDFGKWQSLPGAEKLLTSSTWTDRTLRQALESLFAELHADDKLHERVGPDSNGYMFMDSGLPLILEVLQERTAGLQAGG